MEQQTPKPTPKIALKPVESSQLSAIGHDPKTNTLAIRFKGKDGKLGSLYHYDNFTDYQFAAFEAAESKGSYFAKNIKHNVAAHPYRRIDESKQGDSPAAA